MIHFTQGIISSPRLSGTEVIEWCQKEFSKDNDTFVPQVKGKAAIDLFGSLPDLGGFNPPTPDIDWYEGICITKIHKNFGVKNYGDSYVVILKADFYYTPVKPQ